MDIFILSAARAVQSLFTPGMLKLFILTVAMTIATLIGFVIISSSFFIWLGAHMQGYALAPLLPWMGTLGSAIIAWLLFPGIMPVVVSFFDERIAHTLEQYEYPSALPAHEPDFWMEFLRDVRFALIAILLNLLLLPFYLLPLLGQLLFLLLNGYLLGREFFVMCARRHMPVTEAEAMRKRHGRIVMTAGVALTLLALVPLVNFAAPFWGIAMMVHLYHQLAKTPTPQILPPSHL